MTTISKIALANDKKNKTRSILVMMAIFLATVLLTTICSFAYGAVKSTKVNASAEYGSYYGVYRGVTEEQLTEMNRRSEFTDIGILSYAGYVKSDKETVLVSADSNTLKLSNMDKRLQSGKFPSKENEIVTQKSFLTKLGVQDAKVGDTVKLIYRADLTQKYEEHSFIVSGLLKEWNNEVSQNSDVVYCSQALYDSEHEEGNRSYEVYFRLNKAVSINVDNKEEVLKELAEKCEIDDKQVMTNNYYLMWELDPGKDTIQVCSVLALCVILFSLIVIYNVFQVCLIQKVQEYGKIKALGATNKQMRKLIYREGMFLSVCSIPAGLLGGYLLAWGSFDWLMEKSNMVKTGVESVKVSIFSLPILLLSALLAFITVSLALRKPMRIVARISPVEAVRYQESTARRKGGTRRGKKSVSVCSLVIANIMANRKRTISTILTMGLSCVMFIIVANCVGNIDDEYEARTQVPYGKFELSLDYSLHDKAYPENNLDSILTNNPLGKQLIKEIKEIKGVKSVQTRTILWAEVNGQPTEVEVYSKQDFEGALKKGKGVGNLSYKEASKNGDILFGSSYWMEEYGLSLDQDLEFTLKNGSQTIPFSTKLKGAFVYTGASWIITEDYYRQMNVSAPSYGYLWVDCESKNERAVGKKLDELLQGKKYIDCSSYADELRLVELGSSMMKLGSYLFLAILGLIGFMNLANTMIISIVTQKQQYGILQAVGMTNHQLNVSLQLQGLIFTAGTVFVALLVGLPCGYKIFQYAKSQTFYGLNVYHVPVHEIGLMIGVIIVLQVILSLVLSRNIKKESLVERIRYQG